MKSIFVDSNNKKVEYVNLVDVLKDSYRYIECDTVTQGMFLLHNDTLIVDDEGLLKVGSCGFVIDGCYFHGNGMVWGVDENGNSKDCETSLEWIIPQIKFIDKNEAEVIRKVKLSGKDWREAIFG